MMESCFCIKTLTLRSLCSLLTCDLWLCVCWRTVSQCFRYREHWQDSSEKCQKHEIRLKKQKHSARFFALCVVIRLRKKKHKINKSSKPTFADIAASTKSKAEGHLQLEKKLRRGQYIIFAYSRRNKSKTLFLEWEFLRLLFWMEIKDRTSNYALHIRVESLIFESAELAWQWTLHTGLHLCKRIAFFNLTWGMS